MKFRGKKMLKKNIFLKFVFFLLRHLLTHTPSSLSRYTVDVVVGLGYVEENKQKYEEKNAREREREAQLILSPLF